MSDHHTYKKIEIVGSSRTSIDEAINNALAEAAKSTLAEGTPIKIADHRRKGGGKA